MSPTPKPKVDIYMPTDEEDAIITAAAVSDPDNPPWTEEDFARARPARECFPPDVYARMVDKDEPVVIRHVTDEEDAARQEAARCLPVQSPGQQATIRLDADVMAAFRATGRGWQARINEVLRQAVQSGKIGAQVPGA